MWQFYFEFFKESLQFSILGTPIYIPGTYIYTLVLTLVT